MIASWLIVVPLSGGCKSPSPPARPTALATATPGTPASPQKQVPKLAAGPQPMADVIPADADWPKDTPVDILVLQPMMAADADQAEAALRALLARFRALHHAAHVYGAATAGQLKVVVRFDAGVPPQSALGQVGAAIKSQESDMKRDTPRWATPHLAAVARGARGRIGMTVVAEQGRQEATALISKYGAERLSLVPGITRVSVVGAVRPWWRLELLPPVLRDDHVDLAGVQKALIDWLNQPAPVDGGEGALQKALDSITVPRRAADPVAAMGPVPLSRILVAQRNEGEPVREARNGQLPVTTLLIDAPPSVQDSSVISADNAWRRHPDRSAAYGSATLLHPQFLDSAQRFVLRLKEGQMPESLAALSRRLQNVREMEEMAAVFAAQGLDGIPETVDAEGHAGRVWTVWVTAAAPDLGPVLDRVATALGDGCWQAQPIASDFDNVLGWLIDVSGTGGLIASAPEPAILGAAITKLVNGLRSGKSVAAVQTGPQRHPADKAWAGLARDAANHSGLGGDVVADAAYLPIGPRYLGVVSQAALWLALPTGDRAALQGTLPLGLGHNADGTGDAHAWNLSDFQVLPDLQPIIERIWVDGQPALWLTADAKAARADDFATWFWDEVEREVEIAGGLRLTSLLVTQSTLAAKDAP